MSEIHKGLVAEDPKTKDFGWDAPYVTIDELAPIAFYPPDPEMKAVMEGVIGILHGVDAIWRDILRQERRKVAKGCKDKRTGYLAIHAKKARQRRKNWKRCLRMSVEEIKEAFKA